jgi:hypothetical protein
VSTPSCADSGASWPDLVLLRGISYFQRHMDATSLPCCSSRVQTRCWREAEESNPIPVRRTRFSRPVAGPTPLHHLPNTGAPGKNRTPDPPLTRRLLCQLSYKGMAVRAGIEPATIRLTAGRTTAVLPDKKLWGIEGLVGMAGFEPTKPKQQIYSLPRLTFCAASPLQG